MTAGRPRVQIDQEEFEKLCALHCTCIEIAEWFNCSVDTIERWCKRTYEENFAEVFKKKSSKGKISLRRKMFETAMGGNVTMQIFLSKNVLGYADKIEQRTTEISKEETQKLVKEAKEIAKELENIQ